MDKSYIRKRIFLIRSTKNISARALSLELGMSTEYINQVENGRLTPSLEFILNFCDYFNISVGEFFESSVSYPIEFKSILIELNKMTKEEIEKVYAVMKLINDNKVK